MNMKESVIEAIRDDKNEYLIKGNHIKGYYVEVRTLSRLKLMREYISDFFGNTYIHPQFLNKFMYSSIDSAKWNIKVHIGLSKTN